MSIVGLDATNEHRTFLPTFDGVGDGLPVCCIYTYHPATQGGPTEPPMGARVEIESVSIDEPPGDEITFLLFYSLGCLGAHRYLEAEILAEHERPSDEDDEPMP